MTKDAYFEMCAALGTEPIEEEIPIDFEDFPTEVQEALSIYSKLKDEWDTMSGTYMGKSYSGILDIFNILEVAVQDRKLLFDLITRIDRYRGNVLKEKQKAMEQTEKSIKSLKP